MREISNEQCIAVARAYHQVGTKKGAARYLNIPSTTYGNQLKEAIKRGFVSEDGKILSEELVPAPVADDVVLPEFPDDDIPTEEIIDTMKRRFNKRFEHQQ